MRLAARGLAALLFLLLPLAGAAEEITWETDSLVIETAAGERHAFTVELALTGEQQARGLMHRESLAEDAGMLFVYPRDRMISMWMRNTLISLDMLFLDRRGRIVRIAERTTPLSDATISSGRPARAVLEVPAGTARRLGLATGDRVLHAAFE